MSPQLILHPNFGLVLTLLTAVTAMLPNSRPAESGRASLGPAEPVQIPLTFPADTPFRRPPRTPPSLPALERVASEPALPPGVQTAIPEPASEPANPAVPETEGALLEIQLSRVARRILKAYWLGDNLLLPLAAWLEFAEVRHQVIGGRITGRTEPGMVSFTIDGDSGTARMNGAAIPLGQHDVKMVKGELYGSLGLISQLFELSTAIDREGAAVLIHNPEGLPIARRIQRDAARSIQVGGEPGVAPELIHRGPEQVRSGLVMAYEVRGSSQNPAATTSYGLGLGMGLAGGSAVLWGRGTGEALPQVEGAWSRAWPGQRWLTQLRLGDGPTSGPRPQISRGLSFTNAPINRTLLVEDLPFAGTLPPDWSVEAYRAGRLVGFDSVEASGRFSLTLPIQYGENPVDFVAYGPFGEVRTFNRTFRALPAMVPAGALEYSVSAGACNRSRCSAAANLDLRYGASRRWTFRAGLDQRRGTDRGSLFHPYAGLVATPTNAVGIELEGVANLLYRAGLRFEPSIHLRLTGDYVSYADSGSTSLFLPAGTREQMSLYARIMPGRQTGAMMFEAQGTRTVTSSGPQRQVRAGAAMQLENVVLRPYLRAERSVGGSGSYLGLETTVLPLRALGPIFGGFWLQGQAEATTGGSPTSAGIVIARNLGRPFRIEAGARWERNSAGPVFTLSLVSQLNALRSTSIVTAPSGGGQARLDQSIGGSVVWSQGNNGLALSSEPSLDRAGIGGRVFLDLNGDARWDEDEPPLPGTRLLVGNQWVKADSSGRYRIWGVAPYEEVLISVDTTSLASPWWVPRFAAQAVTPTPNVIRSADVPIDIGGVIEGSLMMDEPTPQPLNRALEVVLTEVGSGRRTVVESFTDGGFYRMGHPPGRYEATVEQRQLERLGLRADTLRLELKGGQSGAEPGPVLSNLRLVLRPLQPSEPPTDR
ncbi:MAG: hypothetical protein ABI785_09520 [Gemmatimonadales bacterium]